MDLTEAEDIKKRWQEYTESESEVAQSCSTLSDPMDCSLLGSSHPWDFPDKVLEWGALSSGGIWQKTYPDVWDLCVSYYDS